jgi:SAM-dependent methyltransferase
VPGPDGDAAPDGSPVGFYALLPPAGEAELIHAAVAHAAVAHAAVAHAAVAHASGADAHAASDTGADAGPRTVLELGCGTGRIMRRLATLGYDVTGVDESAEMLAYAAGAGAAMVRARIEGLDLGRTFDVVLLASHLVNTADDAQRAAFLATAARHTGAAGTVIVQWHPPGWFDTVTETRRERDGVEYHLHDLIRDGPLLHATIDYRTGGRHWRHTFTARRLTPEDLDSALAGAGLRFARWLDPDRRWLVAEPVRPVR